MKTRLYSLVLFGAMLVAPQPAEAQFWEKLGKAAEKILEGAANTNDGKTTTKTNKRTTSKNQTTKQKVEIPTPFKTSATKTMVVRGGAKQLFPFSCGIALVRHQGGWFAINCEGDKLFDLPQGYRPVGVDEYGSGDAEFDNDRMLIKSGSKVAIINDNGDVVKSFSEVMEVCPLKDGLAVIAYGKSSNYKCTYIDKDGNEVVESGPYSNFVMTNQGGISSYQVYPLRDGRRLFYNSKNKRWGYYDENCRVVIPAKFVDCGFFYNGLAQAQGDDGLWGFIDKTGQWAIRPQFTNKPSAFVGPYSLVKDKSGVCYYMDKSGNLIWEDPNPKAHNNYKQFLSTGLTTYVKHDAGVAPAIAPIIIMDASFKQVGMVDRRVVKVFSNGEIVAYCDRWFQYRYNNYQYNMLFDWKGNPLLTFFKGGNFSEGLCASYGGKYYFNEKGEIIVEFVDTKF